MKKEIVDKLQQLKESGASWQRMTKGTAILDNVVDLVTEEEGLRLRVARSHYISGEGRGELDKVCNELIRKYNQDPRTFTKTLL